MCHGAMTASAGRATLISRQLTEISPPVWLRENALSQAKSEPMIDPGLLHDGVRGVSALDPVRHRERTAGDRTVPDRMPAIAQMMTAMRLEDAKHLRRIGGRHDQAVRSSTRSAAMRSVMGSAEGSTMP